MEKQIFVPSNNNKKSIWGTIFFSLMFLWSLWLYFFGTGTMSTLRTGAAPTWQWGIFFGILSFLATLFSIVDLFMKRGKFLLYYDSEKFIYLPESRFQKGPYAWKQITELHLESISNKLVGKGLLIRLKVDGNFIIIEDDEIKMPIEKIYKDFVKYTSLI